jgi:FtsP/CotA-like multicopper oxidase with cupredoxin domain
MRCATSAQRQAAAVRAATARAAAAAATQGRAIHPLAAPPIPGGTPDYFGIYPNYANSPLPTMTATGPVGGIRKFVDTLPGLGPANANNLGQYIPVAVPVMNSNGTPVYPGADYYQIALKDYTQQMHSDLPATTQLRGYADLAGDGKAHYLGPLIIAHRDKPVRVKFSNLLSPNSSYFLPVDTSIMGAGMGPSGGNYSVNRAVIHLHGGVTPWISDGTPHQWITPAGETTAYPRGVSQTNVPDMPDPGAGSATHYYTNQQSSRLMFYHDHSYGITRLNVYAGEESAYILTDPVEEDLISGTNISGVNPGLKKVLPDLGGVYHYGIPLIIQDKTFVPNPTQLTAEDPTWNWGGQGNLWFPHVYMTNQNPSDIMGMNAMGRWDYGPWFWPPLTTMAHGAVPCPSPTNPNQTCPGTPNPSLVPESFLDTPVINGTAYPVLNVQRMAYRFRILNACNDRTLNLQLYYSDPSIASGSPGYGTEVKMVPASYDPSYPSTWPTDQRDGGVPDPATAGPEMIQIGTEGGFLPAPVTLPNTPIGYNYNRRDIVVLNVSNHTLLLGPAERADVIVDFSGVPQGSRLILYNDAPAPVPAFDSRYDYYTGDPDQTSTGGAPTTLPGYGPNTRTIMQFQVSGGTGIPFNIANLNAALPVAYAASQPPPNVPESAYNQVYNASYPDTYSTIQATSLTYAPVGSNSEITTPILSKAIQELFELNYGRMNATLGTELPFTNFNTQTTIPLGYVDPPTEILANGQTQIWKITHNGVDTHAIHFHLFNVQLINRVGWDGAIRPPEANELGWKETVRMNPLEDAIVAIKPILPVVPFAIPDSIRLLDPTMPAGSTGQFTNVDPYTNNPITVVNQMTNFGAEYVWHCHLLGHEENDMMRPMVVGQAPGAPLLTASSGGTDQVTLTWVPGSADQTGFRIERADLATGVFATLATVAANVTTFVDSSVNASTAYSYRIFATNAYGDSPASNVQIVTLDGSGNAKSVLIVTADSKYRMYGAANPPLTGTLTGVVPGDGITVSYSTTAIASSLAGAPYAITPALLDPNNKLSHYSVNSTSGVLTITAAPLSVAINDQARVFGMGNPSLTGTLTGVMNQDGISATYSTVANASSPVGTYAITGTLIDPNGRLSNYAVTNPSGTLNVTYYSLTMPQTLTIHQGQLGVALITMTPINGFTGTVTFSCGTMPVATTCTFTQPQLTGNLEDNPVTTSLVITTNGPNGTAALGRNSTNHSQALYGAFAFIPFGILLVGKSRRKTALTMLFSLAFVLALLMPGCGSSPSVNNPTAIPQTPMGMSTITVNAIVSSTIATNIAPNQQTQIAVTVVP